ncbi:MAG: heat shock protein HspQ [Rhodospirillales bacterium]
MTSTHAKFHVGQLIHHKKFDYRGVIYDVDPEFHGTEDWYKNVARSQPPKDRPWYHVLVDGQDITTYVAERNLEADEDGTPINHPYIRNLFSGLEKGRYVPRQKGN